MEAITGSRSLAPFENIFGTRHYRKLLKGGALEGVYHNGRSWSVAWQGHSVKINQSASGKWLPTGLGVFCAYAEYLKAGSFGTNKARSDFYKDSNLLLIDSASKDEMRLAYAFMLAGLCTVKKKNGLIYLQATLNSVNESQISHLHELLSCSVDRLVYEFLLQSRSLPADFIHNVFAPCYADYLFRLHLKQRQSQKALSSSEKDALAMRVEEIVDAALVEAGIDYSQSKIDPPQLISFKRCAEKSLLQHDTKSDADSSSDSGLSSDSSEDVNPAGIRSRSYQQALNRSISSDSIDSGLGFASINSAEIAPHEGHLDPIDRWYCNQLATKEVNSFASKAMVCLLSIKRWAERNKRTALVNIVDMAVGSIISAALSGGIFGLVFILATICTVIFWFVVDCSILYVKSIWYQRKLDKLYRDRDISDSRDMKDWSFSANKDTDRAIRDMKTMLDSESFFCGYTGFSDLYNTLKNIEKEEQKIVRLRQKSEESVEDALRYQIALGMLGEREKQFEQAGEHAEKYIVGVTQAYTAIKSEYESGFDELWGAMSPLGDEELRNLFVNAVSHIAGDDDPVLTKAKHLLWATPTLKALVNQHIDSCQLDREEMMRELASGVPLKEVLKTEQEKTVLAEAAVKASDSPFSAKLWHLFRYYQNRDTDNESGDYRVATVQTKHEETKVAHRLKKGAKVGIKVLKKYTVDYVRRIPYRMNELLISAGISTPQRALLNPTVTKQAFPNPVSGFGIGIMAWGIVKIVALLAEGKSNADNVKLASNRQNFTNTHRFDEGFNDTVNKTVRLEEKELKALRRLGKDGSAALNKQLAALIELKPQLDSLRERVKNGEDIHSFKDEIARVFLAYQFLNQEISRQLTSSVGLSYQEMLRYKALMKARTSV